MVAILEGVSRLEFWHAKVEIEERRPIMHPQLSYGATMTEPSAENDTEQQANDSDSKVDAAAIAVIFAAAVLMAAHLISGFTIDL
jgi:adenosine/AMP kinase